MPKEVEREGRKYYQCEECGLLYADKETAEKCQAWCSERKSCNLEIIKLAIKEPRQGGVKMIHCIYDDRHYLTIK